MSATRDYLTCAETAKLVRTALKNQFPGIKFSVRSHNYAGGASIDIDWTDGPLSDEVKSVIGLFEGATFDGMIDLKEYHTSLLADDDGNVREVHFGADFIFANRHVSKQRRVYYKRELERFLGHPVDLDSYNGPCEASVIHQADMLGQLSRGEDQYHSHAAAVVEQMGLTREWHGTTCPGGEGSYCPSCGRWQGDHRAPHLY